MPGKTYTTTLQLHAIPVPFDPKDTFGLAKFEPREMERLAVPDPFLVPEAVVEAVAEATA